MSAALAHIVADPPRLNVPNHLLDTQLFPTHATLSNVLAADKQAVHFRGYKPGKVHKQKLSLTNKANGARRMHILAPTSGYFKIRFKKTGKLMPGMSLNIVIEFLSNEYNHHEDFIKIHCEDRHNLVIPLHAYPTLNMSTFPKFISFSNTPVCKSVNKRIKLTSPEPVDFLFKLQYSGHPSLSVFPTSGIIPGEGTIELKVTFCPAEYITANGHFDLMIQQYDAPIYRCNVTGLCQPGTEKDLVFETEASGVLPSLSAVRKTHKLTDPILLDPSTLTPISKNRKTKKVEKEPTQQGTVVNGVRFPENLNNPTAVAFVLNQKPGQLKARELKSGSTAAAIAKQIGNERQLKCAVFESIVKQKALEERNNKLRWMKQLGSEPISEEEKESILAERDRAIQDYMLTQAIFSTEEEFSTTETLCLHSRIYRQAHLHTDLTPTFDPYTSSEWGKRKLALTRFIRAVRQIIVQNRVASRFKVIKTSVGDVRILNRDEYCDIFLSKTGEVTPNYLPLYHREEYDIDMAPHQLGHLSPPNVSLNLEMKYPIFNLHVSRSSNLLGYQEHEISVAAGHEPELPDLRTGAEDELTPVLDESDTLVETVLDPPAELMDPTEYPPLMIFNPAPNIQVQCPPSLYLETSEEYFLDPLLRKPIRHRGPLHPLHKQDVIQGTQRWNKFPSQMLVSLNNTSTIGNVWCPRRDSLLSDDIASSIPVLLTGLTDDLEVVEDDDTLPIAAPTPESVAAEFMLDLEMDQSTDSLPSHYTSHDNTGPVHRRFRQYQLEEYAYEKQNKLGSTIHSRLNSLQQVIKDPNIYIDIQDIKTDPET